MPDGGRLTIGTENMRLTSAQAAALPEARPGEFAALCVTDTGSGIAPEIIPRVFDPFFTTKPQGHGTGLGLSMIYGFVQQSGGHVQISSTVGQGTTVRLCLPRHDGAEPGSVASRPAAATPAATLTAVVVFPTPPF